MKKQGFIFGSMILITSVFITKIIGLVFKIPLANILGGTGMGYFSCAYAIFMPVYAISVTGLPTAVSRMVAENMAFERYTNVRKIRRVAILGFSAVGLLAALLIVILAKPFTIYIGNSAAFPAIIAIAPCVLFGAALSVYRGYYEGLHNMIPTALSQIIESVVKLIAGLGFAYLALLYARTSYTDTGILFDKSYNTLQEAEVAALPFIAAAAIAGVTLSTVVSFLYLFFKYRFSGDGITKEMLLKDKSTDRMRSLLKALFLTVIPIAAGSVVTNLTSLIDLATIIRSLSKTILASPEYFSEKFKGVLDGSDGLLQLPNFIYGSFTGLALTIFNLVPSMTGMFGKGILPSLAESWAKSDHKRTQRSINSVISMTSLVAFPSALGIFILAKPILLLLFSSRTHEVEAVSQSMAVLGIGVLFLSLSISVFTIFQAIGRADLPVKIMFFGVAIKLSGNILLMRIPEINVTGAAISTTVCYAVIAIMSLCLLKKITRAKLKIANAFIKPMFGSLLCIATARLTYDFLFIRLGNSLSVLSAVATGGAVYLISLVLMNISAVKEIKMSFFGK